MLFGEWILTVYLVLLFPFHKRITFLWFNFSLKVKCSAAFYPIPSEIHKGASVCRWSLHKEPWGAQLFYLICSQNLLHDLTLVPAVRLCLIHLFFFFCSSFTSSSALIFSFPLLFPLFGHFANKLSDRKNSIQLSLRSMHSFPFTHSYYKYMLFLLSVVCKGWW